MMRTGRGSQGEIEKIAPLQEMYLKVITEQQ